LSTVTLASLIREARPELLMEHHAEHSTLSAWQQHQPSHSSTAGLKRLSSSMLFASFRNENYCTGTHQLFASFYRNSVAP